MTDRPRDALEELGRLADELEAHPDPAVRAQVTALLQGIDIVHRGALTQLVEAIRAMAGDAFLNRLAADPAVRLLLVSYVLQAVDRWLLAEEALDLVRPHMNADGVHVELLEVVGGVVAVRLHGLSADDPALDGVRRDVEEALQTGLLGFQELEVRDGPAPRATAPEAAFVPREAVRRAQQPVYRTLCSVDELSPGATRSSTVDGMGVLVARVGDEFFAVRNACGTSPLPLDYSTLHGTELHCSWHGCRYDIRTGRRLDRPDASPEEQLRVLPVRVREGVAEVAIGTTAAA